MIRRVLHLAAREWLETRRQPAMIATMATLLALIAGFAVLLLGRLDAIHAMEDGAKALQYWTSLAGLSLSAPLADLTTLVVVSLDLLVFSQLLGMTAVIAGHVGIHDRLCGTRPFLLLAPITRTELLVGKLLGALTMPLAVYVVLGGGAAALAASFEVTATSATWLPPSAGWWVSFAVLAPLWTLAVAALCVAVSLRAKDVRTAQQASWFLVFFATLGLGPLVVQAMAWGPVGWSVVGGLALACLSGVVALGSVRIGTLR